MALIEDKQKAIRGFVMGTHIAKVVKFIRLLALTLVISRGLYAFVFVPPVPPPALLTPATLPFNYSEPPGVVADHIRIVTLDPDQLTGRFSLTLFDNITYIALVDRVEEQDKGNFVWIGHLAGQQESQIKVTVQHQVASGLIVVGDAHYELHSLHDNFYALYERNMLA
jgi:hypothetical protein